MGVTSVDGLVSGLNTTQIIDQLMQIEAQPQTALRAKVSAEQTIISAYQSVNSKFAALLTAAGNLTSSATWQAVTATSTDTSVTASAGAGAATGSLVFDVVSTAAGETYLSTQTYGGLASTALTGPSFTITKADGTTATITPADGSLSSVVAAVNASATGVRAAAVKLGDGTYALQLTSSTTGSAAGFTVAGLDSPLVETSHAVDAVIRLGAGTAAQHDVTSATNTFTGVVPGLTLTVTKPATGVRIDLASDPGKVADSVDALVKAANAALDEIGKYATYDPATKRGGPLMSDSTVRALQQRVLDAVSRAVGSSTVASAGLTLTRDGHVQFNRDAFVSAFTADPTGVQDRFGPTGTFAPAGSFGGTVTLRQASASTQELAGGYAVVITQAAVRASATVNVTAPLQNTDSVTVGGVTVTAATGDTANDLATKLQAALAPSGYSVSLSGSTITLTAAAHGSSGSFTPTVSGADVAVGTVVAGANVAGTVNGVAATGVGQVLTTSATSTAGGMSLLVTLSAADVAAAPGGAVGTFTFQAGVAQRLAHLADAATDRTTGSLTLAVKSHQDAVRGYNDNITDWDARLRLKRESFQRQYAALETALGKLRDQGNWLAGQLASLPGN